MAGGSTEADRAAFAQVSARMRCARQSGFSMALFLAVRQSRSRPRHASRSASWARQTRWKRSRRCVRSARRDLVGRGSDLPAAQRVIHERGGLVSGNPEDGVLHNAPFAFSHAGQHGRGMHSDLLAGDGPRGQFEVFPRSRHAQVGCPRSTWRTNHCRSGGPRVCDVILEASTRLIGKSARKQFDGTDAVKAEGSKRLT